MFPAHDNPQFRAIAPNVQKLLLRNGLKPRVMMTTGNMAILLPEVMHHSMLYFPLCWAVFYRHCILWSGGHLPFWGTHSVRWMSLIAISNSGRNYAICLYLLQVFFDLTFLEVFFSVFGALKSGSVMWCGFTDLVFFTDHEMLFLDFIENFVSLDLWVFLHMYICFTITEWVNVMI